MIVKVHLVLALVIYIKGVSSASFSKVYVQNRAEYPVDYLQYGGPSVPYSPQVAQLTAAPVGSVVPYSSNYVPCGTPCVYPSQVASIAPSANIVQYQPQNLPVVVPSSKSEASGYEYGYVVYDEQTGDYKVQRELSDGSTVRGGYSFLQPDGFVREVQYIADDLQGFNAVVKNYLPTNEDTKKYGDAKKPYHETKDDNPKADETEHQKSAVETGHEDHYAEPSYANLQAHTQEEHYEHHIHESDGISHPEHNEGHEEHHEVHQEHHGDKVGLNEKHHGDIIEPLAEHLESDAKPQKAGEEKVPTKAHGGVLIPKQHEHESYEELVNKAYESAVEAVIEKFAEESIESSESTEKLQLVVIEPEVNKIHNRHITATEHDKGNSMNPAPYNDIIRCVQAAIKEANEVPSAQKPESPLTYIILNKPC